MAMRNTLVLIILLIAPLVVQAERQIRTTVFHTPSAEVESDARRIYTVELLRLALDKTVEEYGLYELRLVSGLSVRRMQQVAQLNKYENFFFKVSYTDQVAEQFTYAPFPIEFGIVGYRVCFVAPSFLQESNQVTTLQQLQQHTVGQGLGWLDLDILQANEVPTVTVSQYLSLFPMVNKNRFDFLCRGINEIKLEMEQFAQSEPLTLNTSFIIRYPLPRFFFTNNNNPMATARINEGLKRAFTDGSAQALMLSFYKENIEFVDVQKRAVIPMTNPLIENIDKSYEQYVWGIEDLVFDK